MEESYWKPIDTNNSPHKPSITVMWLKDANLSHPLSDKALETWSTDNEVTFSLLVASIATVFSYQLASIAFDLSFGFKPYGKVSVSDLSILLLSEESSIFSILAKFGVSSRISRWKFHGRKLYTRL